ncbi:unnamed protein product [Prorocentrum cordatum]|uniref:Protein kinase domain-containing protein n=1 Tax=Prorocentrum cordatum TaxID=2364126 RepID=A0ABN9SBF7_9DINO|nr:unnamed protein product [Polarella glacialis]
MQNAIIHLLFLVCIVVLAAVGKHSLEYHERFLYVTLLNEKRLRFQSEFALSNLHPDLPRRLPSLSGESVPSTSDSARAFALDTDAHECVRRLAQIGEKEQWLIQQDDLSVEPLHLLGEGGFGKVYAGLHQEASVAMKVPKGFLTRSHLVAMTNELRILRRVRHPNIVSLYGACLDELSGTMILVLERMTGVTLGHFLKARRGEGGAAPGMRGLPSEEDRVQILVGLSAALCHLHSRKPLIVHGDLKPSNVFVVNDCPWTPVKVKLLDFGLARSLTKHANPLGGTPRWAAPEVFHGRSRPSTLADVYSFGRIIFFTVTGLQPSVIRWTRMR